MCGRSFPATQYALYRLALPYQSDSSDEKQNDTLIGVKEESDVYTERKNAASGFRFLKSEDASAAMLRRRTLSCKAGQILHDTVIVALACFALAAQWAAYAAEIPADCIYLVASDSSKYHASLTTDATHSNWAGGVKKGEGNYYIPEGMTAQANGTAQTVIGTIYCAGRVTSRGSASEPVTFDDLRLLEGGDLYHSLVCQKRGNITVLSENPDKPSLLSYERTTQWSEWFNLAAAVTGSENSQLLYRMSAGGKGFLILNDGSDWSGFKGTLRIEDGAGIQNVRNVPIVMSGSVRFGRGGILSLKNTDASYSFGGLSFVEDGVITNNASGSALTVSGMFDTGTNCFWLSTNAGTFGTLNLGDGLTLRNPQSSPASLLHVTNRLFVGKNVMIEYPSVLMSFGSNPTSVLLMKLSPEAVSAGIPDLSGVKVVFNDSSTFGFGYLRSEPDADVEDGVLVYATHIPIIRYTGADEYNNAGNRGNWLDPKLSLTGWEDGAYPSGDDKIYCLGVRTFFCSGYTTFPANTLVCRKELCMTGSGFVTNAVLSGADGEVYVRADKLHLGGRLRSVGTGVIRVLDEHTFYLDSTVYGDGDLVFISHKPAETGGATVYLTADNSGWTGKWSTQWLESQCPSNAVYHARIVAGDANALGGNPSDFVYDAQRLDCYAELRLTNTTVQTASNRGLYVKENGIVRVDQGATADMTAPVTLEGTIYKVGAGTFGFGGGIRWALNNDPADGVSPADGMNIVLVKEGAIKGRSLAGAAVTFAADTAIAADDVSGALDLSEATVTALGKVSLMADANTLSEPEQAVVYPIVKVSSSAAESLRDSFKAAKSPWKGWRATLESETDAQGNVIYSVKYGKKGFILSVR